MSAEKRMSREVVINAIGIIAANLTLPKIADDHRCAAHSLRRLWRARFASGSATVASYTTIGDTAYPALGSMVHSDLARSLGADLADEGCIKVDDHQRTSVPGLYAAGDVVSGLDQISHAMGEAGVAATTIRNDLALRAPLRR